MVISINFVVSPPEKNLYKITFGYVNKFVRNLFKCLIANAYFSLPLKFQGYQNQYSVKFYRLPVNTYGRNVQIGKIAGLICNVHKSSWRHTAVSSGEVVLALNITRYAGPLADMILPDGARLQSGAIKTRGWVVGADDNGF